MSDDAPRVPPPEQRSPTPPAWQPAEKQPDDRQSVGTRNAERTRRAVLDAAGRLLVERGTALSLMDVASAAGVSKSGLLHHFGNRDDLLLAVIRDINQQFRQTVIDHLDLSENRPGKMLRAYVRALCDSQTDVAHYFTPSLVWSGIAHIPGVADEMTADERWWNDQLTLDGVDPDITHIICRAAEGIAAATALGEETPDQIARSRALLLAMTDNPANHRQA